MKFIEPCVDDPWTMYILENCNFCKKALKFFYDRKIEIIYNEKSPPTSDIYVRVYIVRIEDKTAFKKQFGEILQDHDTFPVIFEKNKLYGGFDRLIEDFGNPW